MKPLLAMPRPLRVWSQRSPRGTSLWWLAKCNVCNERVHPWVAGAHRSTDVFATPGAAGDEARTHLVQKHPTHPLVL